MDNTCSARARDPMIFCADPSAQFASCQPELEDAVLRVLRSKQHVLGPEVEAFEHEFASFIGTTHAIGVANGTDALELAIRSLDLAPGDEVITVSHTAVATIAAIEAAGAVPVLVDVDPNYYTLAVEQLTQVQSERTKAVIAVHLYGQAADLDAIEAYCRQNRLSLIEDVSQAHGAKWRGKRLGSIGDIACFSCYPTKNLGAIGDAGIVTTNNAELAQRIRMLREYGWRQRYVSEIVGRNSRLDEVQAAILRVKLKYLDQDNVTRQKIADFYDNRLCGLVKTPEVREHADSVFHLYVVQVRNRSKMIEHLRANKIYPGIHYPVPVHRQAAYVNRLRVAKTMVVTEQIANSVLSLPMYPQLSLTKAGRVVEALERFDLECTC